MNRYFWILGAFIALACLIAAKNWFESRQKAPRPAEAAGAPTAH